VLLRCSMIPASLCKTCDMKKPVVHW